METRGRTQDGNGNGSGDGNESSSGNGNGEEDGNEDRIGEGGGEAKKCRKPHKSCRRHVGNGGDLGGKRKKRRKERVVPVAANPDNLLNREYTHTYTHTHTRTISIIDPPSGGSMRVA